MKTGARYHVMRFGPPIGRPDGARRVSIAYHAYSLQEAMVYARTFHAARTVLWIQHRDETAHRHRRRLP